MSTLKRSCSVDAVELFFENDDGSKQLLLVEKSLCTADLCDLLALKNNQAKSIQWAVVEYWNELQIERTFEDHEYGLGLYKDAKRFDAGSIVRLRFRRDFTKYEFLGSPENFFIKQMFVKPDQYNSLQHFLREQSGSPPIAGNVYLRDPKTHHWFKAKLVLTDGKLYFKSKGYFWQPKPECDSQARKVEVLTPPSSFSDSNVKYENLDTTTSNPVVGESRYRLYARLSDYYIYKTLDAKNKKFEAPTVWGICLRPCAAGTGRTEDEDDDVPAIQPQTVGIVEDRMHCIACESDKARKCWLVAMRLAKYGKQIRENYRSFRNRNNEGFRSREFQSYSVTPESSRSRVAMDFTGAVGRIVEDPEEAKAIALAEGYSWKRKWRPSTRSTLSTTQAILPGIHLTQPWFHGGMSRERATALVKKYGTVDGVFLVRESRSQIGAFVLTYKTGNKVVHTQIITLLDVGKDLNVFSLDNGATRFYDLLQLVEFYQLNTGILPTRLTHYVVQSSSPIKVPTSTSIPAPDPNPPSSSKSGKSSKSSKSLKLT